MSTGIPKMSNISVTEPGVTKLLLGLNENKAKGPDSVSPRLLKEVVHELSPALTFLFNQTLLTGEVPEDWKAANITLIFKKGQKSLPENYRPVSLTCILSKVIEHIVYSSISHDLESYNILIPRQHEFRPGHS